MVLLQVVVTVAVSGWCLSELPFVASLALSLAEDRVAFDCNFASPLPKLTIDVVPSSFALDLVMAARLAMGRLGVWFTRRCDYVTRKNSR